MLLPVASQGLTSSVQLGPSFDEQPTTSSQNGAAEGIETVALASEVPWLSHFPPCTQPFALLTQAKLSKSDTHLWVTSTQQNACLLVQRCPATVQAGQDYTALRDHLQAGEFQKADDETRALLIKLAGPDAETRGWVYFTEVCLIMDL